MACAEESSSEDLESSFKKKLSTSDDSDPESFYKKKIVIIGAGISGIACANRLYKLGCQNITILEARDRIGGRINTIKTTLHSRTDLLEQGAQWIHGEGSPIWHLAYFFNVLKEGPKYMDAVYDLNTFSDEDNEKLMTFVDYLETQIKITSLKLEDLSVEATLRVVFRDYIKNGNFTQEEVALFQEFLEWYCKFLLEINGCEKLSLLSQQLLLNYKECEGNQHIDLKGGYSELIGKISKMGSPDWVRRNKCVSKIDYSDFKMPKDVAMKKSRKIKVICQDGDIYFADHLVITIPLGCLKENHKDLFFPPLSMPKQLAINCLGFGTVNKIFLVFEDRKWRKHAVYAVLDKHVKEAKLSQDDRYSPIRYRKDLREDLSMDWTHSINRISYVPGNPQVLCVWCAGDGAEVMESLSDRTVLEDCMKILDSVFKRKLQFPDKMIRSSWNSDPFSKGSYSYLSVQCNSRKIYPSNLAEPIYEDISCAKHPILMFAGEATHDWHYSTVHGAYESGVREANLLFKHYSHNHSSIIEDLPRRHLLLTSKNACEAMKIVIIGAGIAGLSCALHLSQNNFQDITIVDANSKIGGRVSSQYCYGSILELGAQWIHGKENLLFDFAQENDLLPPTLETSHEGKGVFYLSNGEIIPKCIIEEVEKTVNNAKTILDNGSYDTTREFLTSVGVFLEDEFDYSTSWNKSNIELKKDIFEWFVKFEIIDNGCDDLEEVALESFEDWKDCPEELYHINVKTNFSMIPRALLLKVPNAKLHLNTPVLTVKWNENFNFLDTDFDNDRISGNFPVEIVTQERVINADAVIVTASIGFLKENKDKFFLPNLPANKSKSLSCIGYGTVNKIYLIFDEAFWSPTDLGFHFVWKYEDVCGDVPLSCVKEHPWIKGITGFDVVKKYPNVLLGWIGGDEARQVEHVSDECVTKVCTDLLRMFLNKPGICDPIKIVRSSWYSNPYMRGSYSFRRPSFYHQENSLQVLQEPLYCSFAGNKKWPILLLAGEAMDQHSFSSAHGAFSSGLKAAQDLIVACSNLNKPTS